MPKRIKLYHGSDKIVERPELGKGSARNDYGQGFYCTMHYELACEWASKNEAVNGYANEYELDLSSLKVLDLSDPVYNILNWIPTSQSRLCSFRMRSYLSYSSWR